MNKNIITTAIAALGIMGLSATAHAGFDEYNARYVNTPAAKAAALDSICTTGSDEDPIGSDFFVCERWTATGVPDGDIRIAVAATAIIAGGVAGGAVYANPALIGQSGALTVLGNTLNPLQAILLGAGAGALVGASTTLVD